MTDIQKAISKLQERCDYDAFIIGAILDRLVSSGVLDNKGEFLVDVTEGFKRWQEANYGKES